MAVNGENLRLILGLKVKQLRLRRGFALKELAGRANLSISFLSEIENGKKYPKPEKIMVLARALDVPFDELVSLKVDEELDPLRAILDSPFIQAFPFELFGIAPRDIVALVTDSPNKAGAFIRTFLEIGQTYDMAVEHFFLAALRSYQKMHLNYFEEIEKRVVAFLKKHNWEIRSKVSLGKLQSVLEAEYGYELHETNFDESPELNGFRSVWIKGNPHKLFINKSLLPIQKAFVLGREIGCCFLELEERVATSSWIKVESFEQVLNNFKASYFAGALLINRDLLKKDLSSFFQKTCWDGNAFLRMMRKYGATPEMFLYRLSQLIPKLFNLHEIFYLRFYHKAGTEIYDLTKDLNMSRVRVPHGIGLKEHYCRRWLSIRLLKEFAERPQSENREVAIAAQRSRFIESDSEFFTITLARPLALDEANNSSISMGFLVNDSFKRKVRFWNDPTLAEVEVNETCERCGLLPSQCEERAAPNYLHKRGQDQARREVAVQDFMRQME